jgi:1-phosphofructokinase
MVYTVTFNPAIDYTIGIGTLVTGAVNRTESEQVFFGGKGINVSYVLNELGVDNVAMGFVAGFTGKAIEEGITGDGIRCDFVHVEDGFSRINVKVKGQQETEINGQGPKISPRHIDELFQKVDTLQPGDTLVLAGSIPKSLPDGMYQQIVSRVASRGVTVAVDATGTLLLNVLQYNPFVVKPNHLELGELFGVQVSRGNVVCYAQRLQSLGAKNVLVSMGEDGALLLDALQQVHYMPAPVGVAVSTIGAGDSMLAGFLAGVVRGYDYPHALALGVACGSATAFSVGLATRPTIECLYTQMYGDV